MQLRKLFSVLAAGLFASSGLNAQTPDLKTEIERLQQQVQAMQRSDSRSSFNPDLSLILAGQFNSFSQDPEGYAIGGISLAEETGPGESGFTLAESELIISANIDDLFYGRLTAALTPENELELEEALIQTLALPAGLTLQAGRFYSELGYLNIQHPHSWHFVDTALVYRALLGNQYGDTGLQLRWLAPTDLFIELGIETLAGEGFPFGGRANEGQGATNLFLTLGGDLGDSHSWQLGLASLNGDAVGRLTEEDSVSFSGEVSISAIDFIWKWAPQGNPVEQNLIFQFEWLSRQEQGDYTISAATNSIDVSQSGWYSQLIYQFMPRWRVGLRYDQLKLTDSGTAFNGTSLEVSKTDPSRTSLMIDYSRSEFSRLRLQYNQDTSGAETDQQVYLQYIMSLGAHGAHRF